MGIDGILLIDKPAGISSFGVVARVRRIISQEQGKKVKVGHTGTLDPAATGLMILVIGKYCKRASEFSKLDKTYEAELTLGAISTTADSEGEITKKSNYIPGREEVLEALHNFIGEIEQVPPAFSAVKINGQRAYKLAREGRQVDLKPRKVQIFDINDISYNYPKFSFVVRVSSGTYVRSLAIDVGEKLGTGSYLSALRRVEVGDYTLGKALTLDNLSYSDIINNVKQIPPK